MARKRADSNDQRLTVYLKDGAVPGRVLEFTETGLTAYMDAETPRHERLRFTLHLQGAVVVGDLECIGQEDRIARLQFTALTEADRARLAALAPPEG